MLADPDAQERLLELQALDTKADQARHQLATLPELAELASLRVQVGDLERKRMDQQIVVDDLSAEQQKMEADVESVRARKLRDTSRMDQGLIANPKDLERMQQELVSLDRRIASLEDQEIEIMERLEAEQMQLDHIIQEYDDVRRRGAEQVQSRDEKTARLQAELAALETARTPVVADLPADLVALYDKLRAAKDGVGASELRARQCGGCRLTLDAAELNSLRSTPAEEVVRCEECQRILVRTAESGL